MPESKSPSAKPNRRAFSKSAASLAGLSALASVKPAWAGASSAGAPPTADEELLVATAAELESGEVVSFEYPPGNQAFALKLASPASEGAGPDGRYVAFHRACPHMGCPIPTVNAERGELGPCPCHRSLFDLKRGGLQIHGVASQALVQLVLEERDGAVFATGVKGLPYGQPLSERFAR